MDILLDLGVVIVVSIVVAWVLGRAGVTRAFGYIVAGIVAGYALGGLIRPTLTGGFDALSGAALGFVAFTIGQDFTVSGIRHTGARGLLLAIVQALFTYVAMFVGMIGLSAAGVVTLDHVVPEALLLAATATATAPAATFEVIRRLKARGPLTDALSVSVMFDDAVGIVAFDVSVVIARAMMGGVVSPGWGVVAASLRELGLSVLLGSAAGTVYSLCARFLRSRNEVRVLGIGMVLLVVGLSRTGELSPLLASMVLGAVFANLSPRSEAAFDDIDAWSGPLLLLFFFLAGAATDFSLLKTRWPVAAGYIVLRAVGKVVGSGVGASVIRAPRAVQNRLGLSMLPQAGLAVGHALLITSLFPNLQYITMTVVVAVLVFDVVGPVLTSRMLVRCGEAAEQSPSSTDTGGGRQ